MEYIQLEWFHDMDTEPYIIYSEINDQRYEVRKVEVFKNGIIRYREEISDSEIELADIQFPEDLNEINQDKQFHAMYIEKKEFERIWNAE